jgi:hypothetical protein
VTCRCCRCRVLGRRASCCRPLPRPPLLPSPCLSSLCPSSPCPSLPLPRPPPRAPRRPWGQLRGKWATPLLPPSSLPRPPPRPPRPALLAGAGSCSGSSTRAALPTAYPIFPAAHSSAAGGGRHCKSMRSLTNGALQYSSSLQEPFPIPFKSSIKPDPATADSSGVGSEHTLQHVAEAPICRNSCSNALIHFFVTSTTVRNAAVLLSCHGAYARADRALFASNDAGFITIFIPAKQKKCSGSARQPRSAPQTTTRLHRLEAPVLISRNGRLVGSIILC